MTSAAQKAIVKLVEGGKSLGHAVARMDGWQNVITGLGTSRDKRKASNFQETPSVDDETLEGLYHGEDLASRVCDVVPEEALRLGFHVKIEASGDDADEQGRTGDPDKVEPTTSVIKPEDAVALGAEIDGALENLEALENITDVNVWARVFGGSAILVGARDGTPPEFMNTPLREESIQSVDFLNVIDKRHMIPIRWYADPNNPKFGKPETFMITPEIVDTGFAITSGRSMGDTDRNRLFASSRGSLEIHETRMILAEGTRTTTRRRQMNRGFAESVIQRMQDVLTDFNMSWSGVAHLMSDLDQAVFSIDGLIEMIGEGDTDVIQARMQLVDLNRSVARAVAVDAEKEKFERHPTNLAGVSDVLQQFALRLSAAARMPVTKLFGQSPAGMNATGESDERIWNNQLDAWRMQVAAKQIRRLVELVMLSKSGPTGGTMPVNWSIAFPELFTPTAKEAAEIRLIQAQADQIYIIEGAVSAEEIALSRFGVGGWSPDTTIDLGLRKAIRELDAERELERAEDPPTPPTPPVPPVLPNPDDDGNTGHDDDEEREDSADGAHTHVVTVRLDGKLVTLTSSSSGGRGATHTHKIEFPDGTRVRTQAAVSGKQHMHSFVLDGGSEIATSRARKG